MEGRWEEGLRGGILSRYEVVVFTDWLFLMKSMGISA